MPIAPKHPCSHPGCPVLIKNGERMCEAHHMLARRRSEEGRPSSSKRGYDNGWRKARTEHLSEHPNCIECAKRGRAVMATHVDHHVPHKGDMEKFWDSSNWRSLCAFHHNSKTARQDGGLGNPIR